MQKKRKKDKKIELETVCDSSSKQKTILPDYEFLNSEFPTE